MNAKASVTPTGSRAAGSRQKNIGVRLLPSAITVLAMCGGLSALKFALDGKFDIALAMLGAAALLDGLDGRLARLLDATSKMGAELDSLADAINFGVVPAIVVYIGLLEGSSSGWIIVLLYAVSIVLRLARFNTLLDDDSRPAYFKDFFVGVPAPAGALIAACPIAAKLQLGEGWWTSHWLVCGWLVFTSGLVVSRVPTAAMKSIRVPPRLAAALLIVVAVVAAALVTYPFIVLLVLVFAYLLHIPFSIRSARWVAARPEVWDIKPHERRAIRRMPSDGRQRRSMARLGLRRPR